MPWGRAWQRGDVFTYVHEDASGKTIYWAGIVLQSNLIFVFKRKTPEDCKAIYEVPWKAVPEILEDFTAKEKRLFRKALDTQLGVERT